MLTRAPLSFDLSMIGPSGGSVNPTGSSEVVFFVSCPCIGRGVVLHPGSHHHHQPEALLTPTPYRIGGSPCSTLSPGLFATATAPRWCFPDPNSCASAPATPIPNSENMDTSPCFQPCSTTCSENGDLHSLEATQRTLRKCGFYYGGLSWQKAAELLRETSVGTFLVRDSADPRHLFSLSVQTDRGPTSVRIHYADGRFRLDCEDRLTGAMPTFACVLRLLEHYAHLSRTAKGDCCVWLDGTGKRDLRVRLYRPLMAQVPTLKHACRVALNAHLVKGPNMDPKTFEKSVASLRLPGAVANYLVDYPFGL